jgi:serine phosphatase RsbU (regulator of sigma subunit)
LDLSLTFEKYINHSKEDAFNFYSDDENYKSLKFYFLLLSILAGIVSIVYIAEYGFISLKAIASVLSFVILISLRVFYTKIISLNNVRRGIYIFLVACMLAGFIDQIIPEPDAGNTVKSRTGQLRIQSNNNEDEDADLSISAENNGGTFRNIIFFLGISIFFFRLTRNELLQLFIISIGIVVTAQLLVAHNLKAMIISDVVISVFFLSLGLFIEWKSKQKFYKKFLLYHKKHSDTIRIKKELNLARDMQLSMLPESNININDIEISAITVPASEVGGDYFDYFKISENKLGVFICDVAGHGVVSALLLSGIRSCMHLILEETSYPKEVFTKLNRMIRKTQTRNMFVTAIFALIDTAENTCTLYNAGHLPPYRITDSSKEMYKIRKHGIILGALEDFGKTGKDPEIKFDFNKNDKLIFYTDGLTEAMNPLKTEYGFERLEEFLNMNFELPSKMLLDNLYAEIKSFTLDTEQKDDLTILIIGRN